MLLVEFMAKNNCGTFGFAEGRRLINMGVVKINGNTVTDRNFSICEKDFINNEITIEIGKKKKFIFSIDKLKEL